MLTQVRRHHWLFIFVLLCWASSAFALKSQPNFYPVDLPSLQTLGAVHTIAQDKQQFIWIGGTNGLARYDGYTATIWQHDDQDPTSISTNSINDMVFDNQGALWLATYWGLNKYTPEQNRFEPYFHSPDDPYSLSSNSLISIDQSPGGLWVGTQSHGINYFDKTTQTFHRYDKTNSDLASNDIIAVKTDSQGHLWVGYRDAGLSQFVIDGNGLTLKRHFTQAAGEVAHNYVWVIAEDHLGKIWIGTQEGLNLYDPVTDNIQLYGYTDKYSASSKSDLLTIHKTIVDIHEDDKQQLWLTDTVGNVFVISRDRQSLKRVLLKKDGMAKTFFTDSTGGLWAGLAPSGVMRLHRYSSAFAVIKDFPGDDKNPASTEVTGVIEGAADDLWVGTQLSLNRLDSRTGEILNQYFHQDIPGGRHGSSVNGMVWHTPHWLWQGNNWHGLNRLDMNSQQFDQFMPDDGSGIADRQIWSLFNDSYNTLWVGAHQGWLNRFDAQTQKFDALQLNTDYSANRVMTIYEDRNHGLWVGTDNGLYYAKDIQDVTTFKRFDRHSTSGIMPNNDSIFSIYHDSQGNYWFGSSGGGLYFWQPSSQTFRTYMVGDGLAGNSITNILEDDNGYLWFATNNGLSRFDPKLQHFKTYNTAHGLPHNNFAHVASTVLKGGNFAIGSAGGLVIFDPKEVYENTTPPAVVITRFLLFNEDVVPQTSDPHSNTVILEKAINFTDHITLNHRHAVFSFEYAALSYDLPEDNQFAYQLEGFDSDWVQAGTRRQATYTNLNPGQYRFRVKASNNEGVWNTDGTYIDITILPPWWKTWWAYSLYGLAIFSLLAKLIYGQTQKRRAAEAQSRALEIKVAERTQALKEKNTELEAAYQKMEEQSLSDQLTGLKNRRYLHNCLPADMAAAERHYANHHSNLPQLNNDLVFYLIDLDYFKSINDTHGHNNGDNVLKAVAQALLDSCRASDIVARWGGEEFMVISRQTNRAAATETAERLRLAVEKTQIPLDDGEIIHCTCSIGFAAFPCDMHNPKAFNFEQTLHIADFCLYKVKHSGRNGWTGLLRCHIYDRSPKHFLQSLPELVKAGDVILEQSHKPH